MLDHEPLEGERWYRRVSSIAAGGFEAIVEAKCLARANTASALLGSTAGVEAGEEGVVAAAEAEGRAVGRGLVVRSDTMP